MTNGRFKLPTTARMGLHALRRYRAPPVELIGHNTYRGEVTELPTVKKLDKLDKEDA